MTAARMYLVVVALATISCSKPKPYSAEVVTGFVASCVAAAGGQQAMALCSCMIERIQEKIPEDEFRRMDTASRLGKEPSDRMIDAIAAARTACGT
ncbi:hypothetical protein K2Z84_11210 [Candidatus Binatia bacterium]|nr:hypothetical protein [Candidatus Binatia bacterium]